MERPRQYVSFPHLQPFFPYLFDIIVTWGTLDVEIERYRKAIAQQPGLKTKLGDDSRFKRRLSNFEALCGEYFASAPAFGKFLSHEINGIRDIQEDRDLIAHGLYGAHGDGKIVRLVLYGLNLSGAHQQKEYTLEEIKAVSDDIGWYLFVTSIFGSWSADALANVLMEHCSVPRSQVSEVQRLLSPIQATPPLLPSTTPERSA